MKCIQYASTAKVFSVFLPLLSNLAAIHAKLCHIRSIYFSDAVAILEV